MQDFSSQVWFSYLTDWQQELVRTAEKLLKREKLDVFKIEVDGKKNQFVDYSFIVFPMAKAYEGFLKKYFYDLQLIDKKTYFGKRFRVGRALNPDVRQHQRDKYWIFDDVADRCGKDVARHMWETWLKCRNRVFHFFPDEKGKLTLLNAEKKLTMMAEAMSKATTCLNEN